MKIVLLYSGGLDTSICIPWIKENYPGSEIIALTCDVGQGDDEFKGLEKKAIATGASKFYFEDIKDEFVNEYVSPMIKSGANYEGYLLGTSIARPVIAKKAVEIAKKENAYAIAHGCTGKGNDQVRFETAVKSLAPNLKIIAPWREWNIKSREDAISYAESHKIPLNIDRKTNYSKDKNLWHLSHEGLDLENPINEPKYNENGFLEMSNSPENAPDNPEYIEIKFNQGVPVALNDENLSLKDIIIKLNEIGGKHGIGLFDVVENRLIGMKSRGLYETPGGTILVQAHKILETLTLDKDTSHLKSYLSIKFGELVYNGQWFCPAREALSAFFEKTQEFVTGTVKLKLYKGNIINAGVQSKFSLYNQDLASFGESEYDQKQAEGFINLFALTNEVRAKMMEGNI